MQSPLAGNKNTSMRDLKRRGRASIVIRSTIPFFRLNIYSSYNLLIQIS